MKQPLSEPTSLSPATLRPAPATSGGPSTSARTALDPARPDARLQRATLLGHRVVCVSPGAADRIQRFIVIDPAAYARGLGVEQLDMDQIRLYWEIAVKDDYEYALKLAKGLLADQAGTLTSLGEQLRKAVHSNNSKVAYGVLADLVRTINGILATVYGRRHGLEEPPNRETRYATEPVDLFGGKGTKGGMYGHTSLRTGKPEGVLWGDDPTMWERFGKAIGPPVLAGALKRADPRRPENLPIHKLPWSLATLVLPRPMLNLLFDVRFQLETERRVIDERTQDERARRVKSPSAPGTLRSWHQDTAGRLPASAIESGVPKKSVALHEHYTRFSQTGAGSSIGGGIEQPVGLAEYTGTGSNTEHNTKVVLDYTTGRTYLTLTHYQYWALIAGESGFTLWTSGTQALDDAQGRLRDRLARERRRDLRVFLMSPWLEIEMPTLIPKPFEYPQEWREEGFIEKYAFKTLLADPGVQQVSRVFEVQYVSGDQMNCFLRSLARSFGREAEVEDLRELVVQRVPGIHAGDMIDISTPRGRQALTVLAGVGFTDCTIYVVQVVPGTGNITSLHSFRLGTGARPVYVLHAGAHFSALVPSTADPLSHDVFANAVRVDHSAPPEHSGVASSSLSTLAPRLTSDAPSGVKKEIESTLKRRKGQGTPTRDKAEKNLEKVPDRQLDRPRTQVSTTLRERWTALPGSVQVVLAFASLATVIYLLSLFLP